MEDRNPNKHIGKYNWEKTEVFSGRKKCPKITINVFRDIREIITFIKQELIEIKIIWQKWKNSIQYLEYKDDRNEK